VSISRFKSFEETAALLEVRAAELQAMSLTGDTLRVTSPAAFGIQAAAACHLLDLLDHMADDYYPEFSSTQNIAMREKIKSISQAFRSPDGNATLRSIPTPFRSMFCSRYEHPFCYSKMVDGRKVELLVTNWYASDQTSSESLVGFWEWCVAPVIEAHSREKFPRGSRKPSWPTVEYVPALKAQERKAENNLRKFSESLKNGTAPNGAVWARPGQFVSEFADYSNEEIAANLTLRKTTWASMVIELARLIREKFITPAPPSVDPFAALRLVANQLSPNEAKIVLAICDGKGSAPLSSIASLCDWPGDFKDYKGTWNSARYTLNEKLKKHKWIIDTNKPNATASAVN